MKVIRFLRQSRTDSVGEIAFSERHLREKLNGEPALVIMPAKPWYVRLWRKVFPPTGVEI